MADTVREFVADELWLAVVVFTLTVTALLVLAGIEALALVVSIVGGIALAPLLLFWGDEVAALLGDEMEPEGQADRRERTAPDPLAELKSRYARGEIDESEFERHVERLVALDDVDAADADLDVLLGDESSGSVERVAPSQRELERER